VDKKLIKKVFEEKRVFKASPSFSSQSYLRNFKEYEKLYKESLKDPEKFWGKIAEEFEWFQKWEKVRRYNWKTKIEVAWFEGAKTNITVNALDRHLAKRGEKIALIWEGNNSKEIRRFTYRELYAEVCRLANALKSLGVKKGDRVAIYMGMVPELLMSLLACARIGAVHNVIFGGFSVNSLKERIHDCGAKVLLTADGLFRGKKKVLLKPIADEAMKACHKEGHKVKTCLMLRHTKDSVPLKKGRDHKWEEVVSKQSSDCPAEKMDAEDPLFILYTSGSTGKPKGVLHTTGGYMVYVATTFKYIFDYHEKDIFWCTADIGWVTGHSYVVYGPLLNGATTIMFEGVPNYPHPDRFWKVIKKHKVNIFYTAPTAIRALMQEGDKWVKRHNLSSLKLLGSVGEPINPEAWIWYYKNVGKKRCPIVDTWWQTETGGIMVSPFPGATSLKPGSAAWPFFGVKAKIVNEKGKTLPQNKEGFFVIEEPWPSMMRGVYRQPKRMKETYFKKFSGLYYAGDQAKRDKQGYFWFLGRIDDVLKISGHRIGTAEVESALVSHSSVAEAAVVGFTHEIKGQGIHAFVTLKNGIQATDPLKNALIEQVRKTIGPIAKPDRIQFALALPKTRSGKIMRRILQKIAEGQTEDLGDTSTLADPHVVEELLKGQQQNKTD
jgi:acetyl-CoA synthetase